MHKSCLFILLIAILAIPACSPKSSAIMPVAPSYWPTQGWQENTYALEIRFAGDRATITAKERTDAAELTLDGKLQNP